MAPRALSRDYRSFRQLLDLPYSLGFPVGTKTDQGSRPSCCLSPESREKDTQDRLANQAEQERYPKITDVSKSNGREVKWPTSLAIRKGKRARVGLRREKGRNGFEQRREGKENKSHGGRKVLCSDKKGYNDKWHHQEGNDGKPTGLLPEDDRQRADPFLPIEADLVYVLAEDDGCHSNCVGRASPDNIPTPGPSEHIVSAADQQRPPDEQHRNLSHSDVLQRPRVEKYKGHSDGEQKKDYRIPPVQGEQQQSHDDDKPGRYSEIPQQLPRRQQAMCNRLRSVQGAKIVVFVDAANEVGVVVELVVGRMSQDEAYRHDHPRKKPESTVTHGKKACHGAGGEGHYEDRGP